MAKLKVVTSEPSDSELLGFRHSRFVPVRSRWVVYVDGLVVLLVGIFMCLYHTGGGSFGEGDQTAHSLVVQDMVHSGDLFHPNYDGRPYFNKPPFKMWLATIPVRLLGESNFSYRVIDGLSGVGITLLVFFFSLALFGSRLISYMSIMSLLGCRLLFYGHGIRNAVQDSMMLLLMSLGAVIGWYLVETLKWDPNNRRKIYSLAIGGGVTIGLAVLTKNVPGYFAFVILGMFCLFAKQVGLVMRRGWLPIVLSIAISLVIPLSYIYLQGEYRQIAWQMLVVHEVFKRATTGYHFVNQHWYYWNVIVWQRVTVPPELLFLALGYAGRLIYKQHDRAVLFITTWAVIPVLFQSAVKSKLLWYILPAVPGMAMLVGLFVGRVLLKLREPIGNWLIHGKLPNKYVALTASFALYAVIILAGNVQNVAADFFHEQRRNVTDEMVEDILQHSKASGRSYQVIRFDPPRLTKHEMFYWNMLRGAKNQGNIETNDKGELEKYLTSGSADFVITSLKNFEAVAKLHPFTAYNLVPPRNRRRTWLAVLSYVDFVPVNFTPFERRLNMAANEDVFTSGWKESAFFLDRRVRPSSGPVARILLKGNMPQRTLGTDLTLGIASVLPLKDGKGVNAKIYFNTETIGTLENLREGYQDYPMHVPAGKWNSGMNLLTLELSLPENAPIDENRQLILLHSLRIALNRNENVKLH